MLLIPDDDVVAVNSFFLYAIVQQQFVILKIKMFEQREQVIHSVMSSWQEKRLEYNISS